MIRFLILVSLSATILSNSQAQDCPAGGACPQVESVPLGFEDHRIVIPFAPIRGALNLAADVATAPIRAWAPRAAVGGSAGNVSVARYSVPVVRNYATVTSQRTYRVRSWQPLNRVRAGGSAGR